MTNTAVTLIGFLLILVGYVASLWNSYLIMQLIGATTFMWVIWVVGMVFLIIGSVLCAIGRAD
jgi:hypothetical protein